MGWADLALNPVVVVEERHVSEFDAVHIHALPARVRLFKAAAAAATAAVVPLPLFSWSNVAIRRPLARRLVLRCKRAACGLLVGDSQERQAEREPHDLGVTSILPREYTSVSFCYRRKSDMAVEGSHGGRCLYCRGAPVVRGRPAAARLVPTSTGCSRGAEAYRFGHVSRAARCLLACERWLETPGSSASMPRACGRARQARRSSERVFELAARDEPAWLVARRQPAQYALGILYSLTKLSGKVCRDGPSRARWRAQKYHVLLPALCLIGSPAAGLRGALLDGRLLSNLSTVSFTSLLSHSLQPPAGAGVRRRTSILN